MEKKEEEGKGGVKDLLGKIGGGIGGEMWILGRGE